MATWIKENTVPEEVGVYNSATKALVIDNDIKLFEKYSFTKEVKALIPARIGLNVYVIGNVTLLQDLGSKDISWASVKL